jgi:putative phage-type endonuclease
LDPVKAIDGEASAEQAWLVDRRTAITATDVPAILGLSLFSSPIKVWRSKVGDSEDKSDSDAMRWGRRFERPILQAYEERTAKALVYPEPFTLIRSAAVPLIGATLDAWRVDDGAPVDAKNIGFHSDVYGEEGTDDFPPHYAAQLMVQMFVTGAKTADLAVLFSRFDFRVYTLDYDAETAEGLAQRCVEWHERYVVANTPPPVDGTPDYTAFVKRIRQATQMVTRATPEQDTWAAHLATTREQLEMVEMEKDRIENLLKTSIGDARGVEGPQWRALWSQAKDSTGTDFERIARGLAERAGVTETEFAQMMATTQKVTRAGSRRFTFKHGD